MNKTTMVCAVAALVAGGVLTTALTAEAQMPLCSSFATNDAGMPATSVVITGSSASEPIWAALAPTLSALNPPVSIIYQKPSSCVGLNDVVTGATDPSQAYYMDGSSSGVECMNPAAVTIGVSDVFPGSCPVTVPSTFKEFRGPVQVMLFAVPYTSSQSSISADAAYTVFGWGGAQYPVATWTNYQNVFMRGPTSGTQIMISNAIGLAATKWLSQVPDGGSSQLETSSTLMLDALEAAGQGANPSEVIGIIAADVGDQYRGVYGGTSSAPTGGLKLLAFQAATQTCGYLPDSDATHFDKINVRQGRYDIWGPLHLVTAVDGTGTPTAPGVATIIDYITATGLTGAAAQKVIQAEANAHVIPQCAMQVSRSAEVTTDTGGGEASYQPPQGCGCYYESLKNGGVPYSPYCQMTPSGGCSASADAGGSGACPAAYPACNFGFCEVQ